MLKRYLAAYNMRLMIPNVGQLVFTPAFETDKEVEQRAIELHPHFINGNIRDLTAEAEAEEAEPDLPQSPEDEIEALKRMHPFKLFPIAKEMGYPKDGSRKKEDLLRFILQE